MSVTTASSRAFAFSWKEGLLALGGGLGFAALLVAVLRPATESESIALTAPSPQASAPAPVAPPPPLAAAAPAVRPGGSAQGLVLFGVLGGLGEQATAIIGSAGGDQRLVRIGREAAPGVTLKSVERTGVVLDEGGRLVRLALADSAGRSVLTGVDGGGAAAVSELGTYKRRSAAVETTEFRLALMPRTENGRVTGYVIKPGAKVPLFEQAGLRPGDVISLLNGRAFASEREIDGLSREIALSKTLRLGYERGGEILEARMDISE